MKCPYCNNEMQKGYVQNRDGVYWTPKKQWLPAFAFVADGAIPLGRDDKFMSKSIATAYNCTHCKRVIIFYGENDVQD